MNELLVKKDKLIYNGKLFTINDLYTEELYIYSNDNVQKYESNLCIVNEVFLNRVQPALALMLFIQKNQVQVIKMEETDTFLYSLLIDVAGQCNVKIIGTSNFFRVNKIVIGHMTLLASTIFLFWRMLLIPHSDKSDIEESSFAIIRSPAAKKKLTFLRDVNTKIEQLADKETVYNCFGRIKRVGWVLKAWARAYGELRNYKTMIKRSIGINSALEAFTYYSKRVAHTLLYGYMLEDYFHHCEGKTFYTGNNLDRFAIIEEQIANKYNIKTICIPHGLEYGFKLPHCFTCDEFYTTSDSAAKHLNNLYDTEKFIYKEEIAQQTFTVSSYNKKKERTIVFFTEPREVYVNIQIIDELLPLMEKAQMKLSIKLHPKDQKSDYQKYDNRVNFIGEFNDAVSNNICFSRKSTALLEAVYNKSVSGAILLNAKDIAVFNTFPSLQDAKIKVFYSTSNLFEWLKSEC